MSLTKITYTDKQQLNANASINAVNKCQATDMNEIKSVVNSNIDERGDLASLNTTDKTSIVNAINEVDTDLGNALATDGTGFIAYEDITSSVSVNASNIASLTIDTSKTGYTPLGIIGIATGDGAIGVTGYRNYSAASILVFRNFSSSNKSNISVVVRVLYYKNS